MMGNPHQDAVIKLHSRWIFEEVLPNRKLPAFFLGHFGESQKIARDKTFAHPRPFVVNETGIESSDKGAYNGNE